MSRSFDRAFAFIQMDDIVCHGLDGSVFRYLAIRDGDYMPGEVGWVLVLENSSTEIAPQALNASEVLGDMLSMEADPDVARGSVEFFTGEMRDFALRRASETARSTDETTAWLERANELQGELDAVKSESSGS